MRSDDGPAQEWAVTRTLRRSPAYPQVPAIEADSMFTRRQLSRAECACIDPLDDSRDACWISLISLTMNACYFDSQRKDHACKLKQGPKTNAVLAYTTGRATLPLAEAGTEGIVDVPRQHTTRGAFELTRFCWTLNHCREWECLSIDSQLIQPKTSVAPCVATSHD